MNRSCELFSMFIGGLLGIFVGTMIAASLVCSAYETKIQSGTVVIDRGRAKYECKKIAIKSGGKWYSVKDIECQEEE